MRIPKVVKNTINTYYAFQGRSQLGKDVPTDWKSKCLSQVNSACMKHGIGLAASAGIFFLSKGKQKVQISTPFM